MKFKALFAIVSQVSLLLPIVAGWMHYKKLNRPFRLLYYFFLSCIGFELLAAGTRIIYNNNMPGLHLYAIVQFLIFSAVFFHHFKENSTVGRLILFNAIAAFMIAVADVFFIDGIMHNNTVARSYDATSMVIYALVYFYMLFRQDTRLSYNSSDPMFVFTIAVLLYFGNNMFYFMLRRYLLANARHIETFSYYMYLTLNIIAHFLYAQSFRCFNKWKKES